MKKTLLIALCLLLMGCPAVAPAAEGQLNVLLTGGPENNNFEVLLSADGRSYVIQSNFPLEAGGGVCTQPAGDLFHLVCEATAIASFEANSGLGFDRVSISPLVPVPVTLRGGAGNDRLFGGGGSDKIVGGPGSDVIAGRQGDDWLFGGADSDVLIGGPGDDSLFGGEGPDVLRGGPGEDLEPVFPGDERAKSPSRAAGN